MAEEAQRGGEARQHSPMIKSKVAVAGSAAASTKKSQEVPAEGTADLSARPRPLIARRSAASPSRQHQHHHPGRRSVALRLVEEIPKPAPAPLSSVGAPFRSLRSRFASKPTNGGTDSGGLLLMRRSGSLGELSRLDEKQSGGGGGRRSFPGESNRGESDNDGSGGRELTVDRGTITVSWYEGTTSAEMQDHVFNCVLRKLNDGGAVSHRKDGKGGGKIKLEDVRLLDENVTPHEEVVLCPYLPDGSRFLLKFKTSVERPPAPPKVNYRAPPYASRAPDSPSAEPSPYPSHVNLPSLDPMYGANGMNGMHQHQNAQQQMQLLNTVAALLQQQKRQAAATMTTARMAASQQNGDRPKTSHIPFAEPVGMATSNDIPTTPRPETAPAASGGDDARTVSDPNAGGGATESVAEDSATDRLIEQQLLQLNELFARRRSGIVTPVVAKPSTAAGLVNGAVDSRTSDEQTMLKAYRRAEKKHVTLAIANYLVLFMGFIALSAEMQSRLPGWMAWVQENYDSVQNCATDREALGECLAEGDLSGLVASFLLWATQSAVAKRIFLFGFDTPKKLWTVVYEALVSAVCGGLSYLFIRRGLNPNTRENFLHKYWKDAAYGCLATFNAAFMKAVLKNLVPQDVALEALEGGRRWRIFRWLGDSADALEESL